MDRAPLNYGQSGEAAELCWLCSRLTKKKVHLILNTWLKLGIHRWQHTVCGKILLLFFCFVLLPKIFICSFTSWMVCFCSGLRHFHITMHKLYIFFCNRTHRTESNKKQTDSFKDLVRHVNCYVQYCVFSGLYIAPTQLQYRGELCWKFISKALTERMLFDVHRE